MAALGSRLWILLVGRGDVLPDASPIVELRIPAQVSGLDVEPNCEAACSSLCFDCRDVEQRIEDLVCRREVFTPDEDGEQRLEDGVRVLFGEFALPVFERSPSLHDCGNCIEKTAFMYCVFRRTPAKRQRCEREYNLQLVTQSSP